MAAQPWCDGSVGMVGRSCTNNLPVARSRRAAAASEGDLPGAHRQRLLPRLGLPGWRLPPRIQSVLGLDDERAAWRGEAGAALLPPPPEHGAAARSSRAASISTGSPTPPTTTTGSRSRSTGATRNPGPGPERRRLVRRLSRRHARELHRRRARGRLEAERSDSRHRCRALAMQYVPTFSDDSFDIYERQDAIDFVSYQLEFFDRHLRAAPMTVPANRRCDSS